MDPATTMLIGLGVGTIVGNIVAGLIGLYMIRKM